MEFTAMNQIFVERDGIKAQRPIGIDLFAGVGGLSLGFERAGFDVVAAVEIDPIHACVHKFNFPNCAVLPHSVSDLSGAQILKAARIGRRAVDVVFGGAPCQGFSLMGQRVLDDPRNALVNDFVRLVAELDAQYFVFENVKGLTLGPHRKFLDELAAAFDRLGYTIRLPWRVLNAVSFGVPQFRERLILLGAKKGKPLPDYPPSWTAAAGTADRELPAGPSCRDALGDLPDAENFSTLLNVDEVQTEGWGEPSDYARRLRCLVDDAWGYGYRRQWDRNVLTASMRTEHTDISRRRFANTPPGKIEPNSRFFKLPADGVSNTLRAGTDSSRGAFTSPRPIHYDYPRCITVREMARLHGFPDWFRFHETKWHGARQIGNAVPPALGEAVATAVLAAIGAKPILIEDIVPLGSPDLLRMGMSQASAYWGIAPPISRRDRKSGARKRKQHEVEAGRLSGDREYHG